MSNDDASKDAGDGTEAQDPKKSQETPDTSETKDAAQTGAGASEADATAAAQQGADADKPAEQVEDAGKADEAAKVDTAKVDTAKVNTVQADDAKPDTELKPKKSSGAKASAAEGSRSVGALATAFVAGVVAVAAIAALVVFFLQGKDRGEKLDAIHQSTDAACTFGQDVSIYDYSKNLDDYFAKVKDGSTGEFLKEFGDATEALKGAMVQAKVKSWVDDVQCGYQSGDKESAKVLITLTQFRQNFSQPEPNRQFVVIIANLKKDGDKWLVEKLDSPMLKGAGTGLPGGAPAPGADTPAPGAEAPAPGGGDSPAPAPGN